MVTGFWSAERDDRYSNPMVEHDKCCICLTGTSQNRAWRRASAWTASRMSSYNRFPEPLEADA
jgi:hypothetical protein